MLQDRQQILHRPIKNQSRRKTIAKNEEDKRHEAEDLLLRIVHRHRHHPHLIKHRRAHEEGQDVDRQTKKMPHSIRSRKILNPQKFRETELRGTHDHPEKSKKDRNLDKHRKTTTDRIDLMLLEELRSEEHT